MPDLEANKRTVTAFYDLMFNQCQPAEVAASGLHILQLVTES
jgi:hypothetical protein